MPAWDLIRYLLLALGLVAATLTDIQSRRIPNSLTASLGLLGGVCVAIEGSAGLLAGVACAGLLWGLRVLGLWVFGRPGMGMGDVKLAAGLGLVLGWPALGCLYLALLTAGIWAAAGLAVGRLRRDSRLPFAPCILAGTLIGMVVLWLAS